MSVAGRPATVAWAGLGAWLASAAQRAMPARHRWGPIRRAKVTAGGSISTGQTRSIGSVSGPTERGRHGHPRRVAGRSCRDLRGSPASGKHALARAVLRTGSAVYADGGESTAIEAWSTHSPAIYAVGGHLGAIRCGAQDGHGIQASSNTRTGVMGTSSRQSGVVGIGLDGVVGRGSRWAGRFDGMCLSKGTAHSRRRGCLPHRRPTKLLLMPATPSGKDELCVQFPSGGVLVVATEP